TADQAFAGRFLVAEVRVHDRGAAAPDLADLVVLLRLAVLAADLHFHIGQRLAAIDDRPVARRAREVAAGSGEPLLLDQLDADSFTRRHHGDGERRFSEAVA